MQDNRFIGGGKGRLQSNRFRLVKESNMKFYLRFSKIATISIYIIFGLMLTALTFDFLI